MFKGKSFIILLLLLVYTAVGLFSFEQHILRYAEGIFFKLSDFRVYCEAFELLQRGDTPYRRLALGYAFLYPPHALLWLAPLYLLDSASHSALIVLVTFFHVSSILLFTVLICRQERLSSQSTFFSVILALFFAPLLASIHQGQINFVIFVAVISMYLFEATRPRLAGYLLTIGGLTKLTPFAFLLYLMLRENKRCCRAVAEATVIFTILTIAIFGFGLIKQYFDYLTYLTAQFPIDKELSRSFAAMLYWLGLVPKSSIVLLQRWYSIFLVLITAAAALKAHYSKNYLPLLIILTICSVIFPPIVWYYHFTALFPALFVFLIRYRSKLSYNLIAIGAFLAINAEFYPPLFLVTRGLLTYFFFAAIVTVCLFDRSVGNDTVVLG
jgi:hypothetical protein